MDMVVDILVKNHNFGNQLVAVLIVTIALIVFVVLDQINVSSVLLFLGHDLPLCFCSIVLNSKRRVVHTWTGAILPDRCKAHLPDKTLLNKFHGILLFFVQANTFQSFS